MGRGPRYAEPFFWWGQSWAAPRQRTIADLLRDGTIDPATAAILWAALSRRTSLAVIAGPSGAGKSTLLAALLELLPPETRRVYIQGCYETFAFLTDPEIAPRQTALLVNEISPHLPVYLWGPALERLLTAAERGFAILATAHAATVPEFVGALSGSPLRIPAARLAAFELVVVLEPSRRTASGRRVASVWRLRPSRDGVAIEPATDGEFPPQELQERTRALTAVRDGFIDLLPDVAPTAGEGEGSGSP